mmetsp:Transcript_63368/g.112250  ORF Transcript_63368/g.112250 Transcript_63368/m.112250 type:complete len:84 (-) Transcript_63368:87-338(-)
MEAITVFLIRSRLDANMRLAASCVQITHLQETHAILFASPGFILDLSVRNSFPSLIWSAFTDLSRTTERRICAISKVATAWEM